MDNTLKSRESFVALFDILGFSNLVEKNELSKVATVYEKAIDEFKFNANFINEVLDDSDAVNFHVFSDTILIYTASISDDHFTALLAACDFLFIAAMANELPIRGSISAGPLIASNGIEVGIPIVQAYKHEKRQDWIGCWILDDCISRIQCLDDLLQENTILKYSIPLKDGQVKSHYVFNWIKSLSFEVQFNNRKNDFSIDQIYSQLRFIREALPDRWDVKRKYDNTSQFVAHALSPELIESYKGLSLIHRKK